MPPDLLLPLYPGCATICNLFPFVPFFFFFFQLSSCLAVTAVSPGSAAALPARNDGPAAALVNACFLPGCDARLEILRGRRRCFQMWRVFIFIFWGRGGARDHAECGIGDCRTMPLRRLGWGSSVTKVKYKGWTIETQLSLPGLLRGTCIHTLGKSGRAGQNSTKGVDVVRCSPVQDGDFLISSAST